MKIISSVAVAIVMMGSLLVTGCVTRIGDATLLSTKNMDIKKSLHRVDTVHRVQGEDLQKIIICFSTGTPTLKEGVDKCIQRSPECVGLSNAVMYYGSWYIPFIYGESFYRVEGNPVYEVKDVKANK